jgi:hypothetical protein
MAATLYWVVYPDSAKDPTNAAAAELSAAPLRLFEDRRIYVPQSAATSGVPTISDLQAVNITAGTVQATYDYTF